MLGLLLEIQLLVIKWDDVLLREYVMTDYYHVVLEKKQKGPKGKASYVYWFDCTDFDEIDEDVLTPYVKKTELYIDGSYIQYNEIQSLSIKKSVVPIDTLVQQAYNRLSAGIIVVISKMTIIHGDNGFENLTRSLVKDKKKELEVERAELVAPKDLDISKIPNNKVFIVHGRDNEAKLEMARFLEKAGLEAIVLHEQASRSMTIIEKIEQYGDVGFVVVLYTPCDIGGLNDEGMELVPRARQNVVFEHGYFIGLLDRSRVSAFVKGNIEKPNDISGVVYTDLDQAGAWKMSLLKELKEVGYSVNAEALL